ncbi:MAG: FAD-dependent oxidoreductase, partial [bacterium]
MNTNRTTPQAGSIFTRFFDVGVFGAGYAGFAAAMELAASGKSVFLADLRGDLLWESGRAFQMPTGPWTPGFRLLSDCLARITGVTSEWFDGGTAEVVATELLRDAGLPVLYYVAPLGVVREGDELRAVTVATKGGLRKLVARQWIDATENGTIAQLLDPALRPRNPARLLTHVMLQRMRWPEAPASALDAPAELAECRLEWAPAPYGSERTLTIDMPGDEPRFLRTVAPSLRALRARLGAELGDAFVSHLSFTPYPLYDPARGVKAPAANLALAVPGLAGRPVRTLAERFELGLAAARELADQRAGKIDTKSRTREIPVAPVFREATAEIAVAGLGTGGVLAAVAAARAGAGVVAFDMASFAGGIGVGAGIPVYYYGCPGGLQDEVDSRVRDLMPLFASRDIWERGFHPDVKRIVVADLLDSAGVRTLFGALTSTVERAGRRIEATVVATPDGPVRIRARAWIDASGDGDLCAMAGA